MFYLSNIGPLSDNMLARPLEHENTNNLPVGLTLLIFINVWFLLVFAFIAHKRNGSSLDLPGKTPSHRNPNIYPAILVQK